MTATHKTDAKPEATKPIAQGLLIKTMRMPNIVGVNFMDRDNVMVSVGFPADMLLVSSQIGPNGKPAVLKAAKCSDDTLIANAEAYLMGKMLGPVN